MACVHVLRRRNRIMTHPSVPQLSKMAVPWGHPCKHVFCNHLSSKEKKKHAYNEHIVPKNYAPLPSRFWHGFAGVLYRTCVHWGVLTWKCYPVHKHSYKCCHPFVEQERLDKFKASLQVRFFFYSYSCRVAFIFGLPVKSARKIDPHNSKLKFSLKVYFSSQL